MDLNDLIDKAFDKVVLSSNERGFEETFIGEIKSSVGILVKVAK